MILKGTNLGVNEKKDEGHKAIGKSSDTFILDLPKINSSTNNQKSNKIT